MYNVIKVPKPSLSGYARRVELSGGDSGEGPDDEKDE